MTAVAAPRTRPLGYRDVPDLPHDRVLELHARHLNPGLITLMRLGGYDAVRPVRARGAYVELDDGRKVLDLISSYGALNHGHNHPRVLAAARWFDEQEQPDLLKEFASPWPAALAENLLAIVPEGLDSVFFCNSGTEAVEGAMKLAVRASGGARDRFVYAENSLHGKTFGSLQVTGREKYRGFVPRFPDWPMVPYGDAAAIEAVLAAPGGERIAGVVLEPVQGEGGVVVPPKGYLKAVEQACRRHGVLLILDEIQTAVGRTGWMFRCQSEDVTPDVLCLAKSIGGGVATIGATVARSDLQRAAYGSVEQCLVHTSTFGGRARACAVAMEALQVAQDEDFAGRARTLGAELREGLEAVRARHPDTIRGIRGDGLMLGVEFHDPDIKVPPLFPKELVARIAARSLPGVVGAELLASHDVLASFVLNNPRVLRIYPPLVATREDLARVPAALEAVVEKGLGRLVAGVLQRAVKAHGLTTVVGWLRRW